MTPLATERQSSKTEKEERVPSILEREWNEQEYLQESVVLPVVVASLEQQDAGRVTTKDIGRFRMPP